MEETLRKMVSKLGRRVGEKGLGKDWDLGTFLVPPALSLDFRRPPVIAALQSFILIPSLPPQMIIYFILTTAQTVCDRVTCYQEEIRID